MLKSATQTVPASREGSQQSSGQLRSLDGEAQLPSLASPNNQQPANEEHLDLLDESELLLLKQRPGVEAELVEALSIDSSPVDLQSSTDFLNLNEELTLTLQQREAISRRHHFKFITGHYGSGKVTGSYT